MKRYYDKRKLRRYNRKLKNLKRNEKIRVNNERANDVNVIDDYDAHFCSDYDDVNVIDDYDAHCCSAYDDGNGYCAFCGAVIPGTFAYTEVYGGDAPEVPRYHWSDYD